MLNSDVVHYFCVIDSNRCIKFFFLSKYVREINKTIVKLVATPLVYCLLFHSPPTTTTTSSTVSRPNQFLGSGRLDACVP